MTGVSVGLIGIGEAGAAIAAGLREAGAEVIGYDARADHDEVRARATAAGVTLVDSLRRLASCSPVLICLTSAKAALPIAREVAPHLTPDHLYGDWNSTSPRLKQDVAEVVAGSGAGFADGAIMSAVPPRRHRAPVLLSGSGAGKLAEALAGLDMNLTLLGGEPGQASAVKMFRSLLVKGLEALLLECAVGAQSYGVTEHVLASMPGDLPMHDWNQLGAYLLQRTIGHGERRAEELRQVAGALSDHGIEPWLAEAGARRLQWLVDLDPAALGLTDGAGFDYPDALDAIGQRRRET